MPDTETMNNIKDAGAHLSEKVRDVKGKAEALGRSAGDHLDAARAETADALHTAASSVRSAADTGTGAIDGFANSAANKLDSAATYVRDHDARAAVGEWLHVVRRHPGRSMAIALAIGFFAGSSIRKR